MLDLVVDRDALQSALDMLVIFVAGVKKKPPVVEIAQADETHVLLTSCTDYGRMSITLEASYGAKSSEVRYLNIRRLAKIIKTLQGDSVEIKQDRRHPALVLFSCEKTRIGVSSVNADDMRTLGVPWCNWITKARDEQPLWMISAAGLDIQRALRVVVPVMAEDSVRYGLHQLCLHRPTRGKELPDGVLRVVATDGHRMHYTDLTAEVVKMERSSINIGFDMAKLLARFSNHASIWDLSGGDMWIAMRGGSINIESRDDVGEFPDYERILPDKSTLSITFPRAQVVSALRRAIMFNANPNRITKVTLGSDEELIFEAASSTASIADRTSETFSETVPVEVDGERLSFGVNAGYLSTVCSLSKDRMITAKMTHALAPILFSAEGAPWCCVIMPMWLD